MRRFVLVPLFIYLSCGVSGQSLTKLVNEIFKPQGNKTTSTMATTVDDVRAKNSNPSENKDANESGDETCDCVAYYLCSMDNTKIKDGAGLIDIKGSGDCENYLDVCCEPRGTHVTPNDRSKGPIRECGYRNPEGVGFRITGDKDGEAQFGEFPWMVAVLVEEFNSATETTLDVYKCGGTLIHPQVVLTAAHCVSIRDKKYKIRAGEWDTQTTKELIPYQDRYVQKTVSHSKYYAGALFNDIAILFLDSPFALTQTINALCLPEQDAVMPSGTRCVASGWGKDVFGKEGRYQVILKKVDLPMVERNTCQNQLRTTRLGKYFELDGSFVCAGGEGGKDTCKGDGGSPLACPIPGQKNRYQHVGMVAWGIGCGEEQVPGVYVNVAMFRQWIDEQMASQNLDKSTYQY